MGPCRVHARHQCRHLTQGRTSWGATGATRPVCDCAMERLCPCHGLQNAKPTMRGLSVCERVALWGGVVYIIALDQSSSARAVGDMARTCCCLRDAVAIGPRHEKKRTLLL